MAAYVHGVRGSEVTGGLPLASPALGVSSGTSVTYSLAGYVQADGGGALLGSPARGELGVGGA